MCMRGVCVRVCVQESVCVCARECYAHVYACMRVQGMCVCVCRVYVCAQVELVCDDVCLVCACVFVPVCICVSVC